VVEDRPDSQLDELISSIQITNSLFQDNNAVYGGAIDIEPGDDSLQIEILTNNFTRNGNSQGLGGGIVVSGYGTLRGNCKMINNTFANNSGVLAGGVVIQNSNNPNTLWYELKDCIFSENDGPNGGGGLVIRSYPETNHIAGTISNTLFNNNSSVAGGGAVYFYGGIHQIIDSDFNLNYTDGIFDTIPIGGAALVIDGTAEASVERCQFDRNTSLTNGAAISTILGATCNLDNSIFINQSGLSTIWNRGNMDMVNVTLSGQPAGLVAETGSETSFQNSVFNTQQGNLIIQGKPHITSRGGNISSDGTMTGVLTGSGSYNDLHNTDPLLAIDFVPLSGSPCIDAGNPEGITTPIDLAGNPRIHGGAIDAGSYESLFTSTNDQAGSISDLTIYPNPTSGDLIVELKENTIAGSRIQVLNLAGQIVLNKRVETGNVIQVVNTYALPAGTYNIQIAAEGQVLGLNKFVKM